jgi:hypothetical protein
MKMDNPFIQALLTLKCTSCSHPVHVSFTDTPGCTYHLGIRDYKPGDICQCQRATICGDDILQLVRDFRQEVILDCAEMIISSPEDLLQFHRYCAARGQRLMGLKNHDYAGYAAQRGDLDVMKNFRAHEEYGIVVRMGDKLKRLENFALSGKLMVEDESIFDTAIDLLNYAILYLAYGREHRTRLLREGISETRRGLAPAIVGDQYNTLLKLYHLLDDKKISRLREDGHNTLAATLAEIRSYQWQDNLPKTYVVHNLLTGGYIKLNEDGYIGSTLQAPDGEDDWVRHTGSLALIRNNEELPPGYIVYAEMPINEHTRQIQFGVGNEHR